MNSPTPKECYDCQISARIRKQMLDVTNIDSMAKLQACLRQLCNKCQVWDIGNSKREAEMKVRGFNSIRLVSQNVTAYLGLSLIYVFYIPKRRNPVITCDTYGDWTDD